MTIKTFAFNPFQTNCYVCHDGKAAVIIDPGCYTQDEVDLLLGYVEAEDLEVQQLLLTHGHLDHIFGCKAIAEAFGMGFWMHAQDEPLLKRALNDAGRYGVTIAPPPTPAGFLDERDRIQFGKADWEIRFAPGHSPGSICFYDAANGFVIAGDVLFQGSVGRTDLWRGSMPELLRSIFEQLMTLDDNVKVYPGHGPATTIGAERRFNPFLTESL